MRKPVIVCLATLGLTLLIAVSVGLMSMMMSAQADIDPDENDEEVSHSISTVSGWVSAVSEDRVQIADSIEDIDELTFGLRLSISDITTIEKNGQEISALELEIGDYVVVTISGGIEETSPAYAATVHLIKVE